MPLVLLICILPFTCAVTLKYGVQGPVAATNGNQVLIAGGFNSTQTVTTINVFDLTTFTINTTVELPASRMDFAAAFFAGNLSNITWHSSFFFY